MIGQYLPNNNETRYSVILLNFSDLNWPIAIQWMATFVYKVAVGLISCKFLRSQKLADPNIDPNISLELEISDEMSEFTRTTCACVLAHSS
jgi:hypothetical protein